MKLLREIRENTIKSGKLKNYLIYAVGEIILVVLGILIALQINNWNEERKERKLEQDYYCRLLEDLQQDQQFLNKLVDDNEIRIRGSNELLHVLQQNAPSRIEVIGKTRNAIAKTTFTFKPNQVAYEDLKSGGNLNVLKDIALKAKLINYYSTMEGLTDVVDVNSDAAVAMYYDTKQDFIDMGWSDLPTIAAALDTTLVDVQLFRTPNYPSQELRKRLTSDAMLYLGTNVRKRALYQDMAVEIDAMREALMKKCIPVP